MDDNEFYWDPCFHVLHYDCESDVGTVVCMYPFIIGEKHHHYIFRVANFLRKEGIGMDRIFNIRLEDELEQEVQR